MRRRSLRRQLVLGALVAVLVVLAVPIVYVAGREGIDAVRTGEPRTAIEQGLVALIAAFVPVIAIAAYAHWLYVTSRPHNEHEPHVPTRSEDVLLGIATVAVVFGAWPVVGFSYREATRAFETGITGLASGVAYACLGVAYLAFAALCAIRYVRWLR